MNEAFWRGFFATPRLCSQSPFWFLNDVVDGEVYCEQVEAMAAQGVMQVTPHPRYGMDRREYLSPKYMEDFAQMVERADELGMGINLYDDFNWSSGQCGGKITADRHMCALGLAINKVHVHGGRVMFDRWTDGFQGWAQFESIVLTGWAAYKSDTELDFQQLTLNDHWKLENGVFTMEVPEGDWIAFVVYTVRTIHESLLREGNGGIIDYLGAEPTRRFIEMTHEVYYARLGKYFGNTIQSIFSDEVGPYACGDFTWTSDFEEYFFQRKGYDIRPRLLMLYYDGDPMAAKVRWDYWDTVTSAYQERFMRPIADWCRKHNIASTGHTFEESRLWMISGSMYESMRTQTWVGVDSLLGYKPYSMLKPAISVAHVTGRSTVLCEAVGVIGEEIGEYGSWTCSPRQVKYAYNQLGVAGVSLMVPHAFFQSVDNPKAECPPSFFKDNHYWRYYRDIARLTDIMCYVNRETTHVADVAVFYPITSWWATSRGGRGRGMPTSIQRNGAAECDKESAAFDEIIDGLMRRQLDHDVLDLKALEEAEISDGCIKIHDECYRVLVVPPMHSVSLRELNRFELLVQKGVKIISYGSFEPTASVEVGEGDTQVVQSLARLRNRVRPVSDMDAMEHSIRSAIVADITILEGDRNYLDAAHRRTEGINIYLLSNLKDTPMTLRLLLRSKARFGQLLDCLGKPLRSNLIFDQNTTLAYVTLPAEELCYLVLSEDLLPAKLTGSTTCMQRCSHTLRDEHGWQFSVAPEFNGSFPFGQLPMQSLKVPLGKTFELREASGDVDFLSNWMQLDFDDSDWKQIVLKRNTAQYFHKNSQLFRFKVPVGACALRMPFPSECEYVLYFNGVHVVSMMDFQPDQPCWIPLTGCERNPGVLAVETASMRPGFGMTGAPEFLMRPINEPLSSWGEWGLEWYSGFGIYEKRFYCDGMPDGEIWLQLGDVRECCEVWVNGERIGHRIWPPYQLEISRYVRSGENVLRIAVCNLMSNEYTWDVIGSRGTGRYLPSGLMGNVFLNDLSLL